MILIFGTFFFDNFWSGTIVPIFLVPSPLVYIPTTLSCHSVSCTSLRFDFVDFLRFASSQSGRFSQDTKWTKLAVDWSKRSVRYQVGKCLKLRLLSPVSHLVFDTRRVDKRTSGRLIGLPLCSPVCRCCSWGSV